MAALDAIRTAPQSRQAEQAVIGGCLLQPRAYHRLAGMVTHTDFYSRDHQLIFRAIMALAEQGEDFDTVTLGEWLETRGFPGQMPYLIELASTTPSAANIVAYAEIVRDRAIKRNLIDYGTTLVNNAFASDSHTPAMELYVGAQAALMQAGPKALSSIPTPKDVLRNVVRFMQDRLRDDAGKLLGYATELTDLDRQLNGLEAGTLTVVAARPSMGKTALMLQMAISGALKGQRVFIASMEMSDTSMMMRAIANHGRVNLRSIRSPKEAEDGDLARVKLAAKDLAESGLLIDDSPQSVDSLCARIRQLHMESPLTIVFIDYLQHMEMPKADTHSLAVQQITRKLKNLAKELKIAIVLLSQLNRSLEARGDKRPMMSDLRESGAIEQDADNVVFIYRDEYYNPDSEFKDMAELIIGKARNEATGRVYVKTNLAMQLFMDCPKEDVPLVQSKSQKREASRPAVGAGPTRRYGAGPARSQASQGQD